MVVAPGSTTKPPWPSPWPSASLTQLVFTFLFTWEIWPSQPLSTCITPTKTFTGHRGPPAPWAPRWPPWWPPWCPPVPGGRLPAPGRLGPWSGYFCFVTPSWAALASRYSAVTGAAQLTRLLSRPPLTNTAVVFAPPARHANHPPHRGI